MSQIGPTRQLAALVARFDQLEVLGTAAQGADESDAEVAVRELQNLYPGWYSAAREVLPVDLRVKFEAEYEGTRFLPKIKHYIARPRDRWSLYDKRIPGFLRRHGEWQFQLAGSFQNPIREQRRILVMAQGRLGIDPQRLQALDQLAQICRRLPQAIAVLERIQHQRTGLVVRDEYDLQRILHALLVVHFDDVEVEDNTSRRAGGSFRIDFVLRQEGIAVEAKMTRESLTTKQVRDQLLQDIFGYKAHDRVSALFGVIFDPQHHIFNPNGFESDLKVDDPEFPVRVVVAQG